MEKFRSPCLSSVRQKYLNSKVLGQSAAILPKGWHSQTNKRYKPYLKKWLKFCCERNKHPNHPDLNDTFEFLISVFHTGVGYSSINTARSSQSALIEPINDLTLGKQPIIQRYMRGIFNSRLSLPNHTATWNPDNALNYFNSVPVNDDLTLKQLSHKVTNLRPYCVYCLDREIKLFQNFLSNTWFSLMTNVHFTSLPY